MIVKYSIHNRSLYKILCQNIKYIASNVLQVIVAADKQNENCIVNKLKKFITNKNTNVITISKSFDVFVYTLSCITVHTHVQYVFQK